MKRKVILAVVVTVLMVVGVSSAALAGPSPVLHVYGSGTVAVDSTVARVSIDAQSLGKPETRTYTTPGGTVISYDVYKCKGFVNISVESAGFSFKARVKEMYATWEGVYGVVITYQFRGTDYRMRITEGATGDHVWLAPLPIIGVETADTSVIEGGFTVVAP